MKPMDPYQNNMLRIFAILLLLAILTVEAFSANERSLPENLLLKNFCPRSIYNVPRTNINKARYPAIDMHAHAYADNNKQILEWIRIMDEAGIEKAIILTGETGKAFDVIYERYSQYRDHFEVWCGLDYTGYDKPGFGAGAVRELERCYKLGARGVGELGDKGKGLFYSKPLRSRIMRPKVLC